LSSATSVKGQGLGPQKQESSWTISQLEEEQGGQ